MAQNLTSLLNPFSERTTFVYDALNRAVTVTHGNQTKAEHDYNGAGWLTALRNLKSDNSPISIFTYTYDNAANRLSMAEANGDRVTWTYDALYQLTRERRSGANSFDITYSYDPVGNRLTKLEGGTTTTYTYDSANELTTEVTPTQTTTYSYDSNGNTTLKNAAGALTTYTWDGENRMTKLEQPTSPAVMTFTYDANSFRRTLHDGTSLTKFLNDWGTGMPGIDPVLIETDGSDSTIVTYTPALLHGLLSLTRHPSLVTHWYHFEGIGSTRQLTDASQAITDTYLYEAFGKEVVTSGTTVNSFRYVGAFGYFDDGKSGLILLGVRVVKPTTGRFLTQDIPKSQGNWYVYANNTPTVFIDISGREPLYAMGFSQGIGGGIISESIPLGGTIPHSGKGCSCLPHNPEACITKFCAALSNKNLVKACAKKYLTGGSVSISDIMKCFATWCKNGPDIVCTDNCTKNFDWECHPDCKHPKKKKTIKVPACAQSDPVGSKPNPKPKITICCYWYDGSFSTQCPAGAWPTDCNVYYMPIHELGHQCSAQGNAAEAQINAFQACVAQKVPCP